MPADLQNFDSDEYSWSQGEASIAGAPITTKMRGLSFVIESDDEELFAGGDEAIDIQSGNVKKSGSVTILGAGLDALQAAAVAKGGRFITDIRCDIVWTILPGIGRPLITYVLVGVKFNKMPKGWKQGDKFMDCELPFKFLRLR
jgi:hypothetical protein